LTPEDAVRSRPDSISKGPCGLRLLFCHLALLWAALCGEVCLAETGYHTDCGTCHGKSSAALSKTAGDPGTSCTGCHTGRAKAHVAFHRTEVDGKPGGCLACHDPHEGAAPHFLRAGGTPEDLVCLDPGSRVCIDCHEGHVGTQGSTGKHPVGVRLSRRAASAEEPPFVLPLADIASTEDASDDVIACTTCHNVHGSTHRYLLRWSGEDAVEGCSSCHTERVPARRTRPVEASLTGDRGGL
jgi:predicted CXXCH cytochrome family protein